jgi:hypothetical protein
MDLFKIEENRRELLRNLNSDTSLNQKIDLLNEFFSILIDSEDETILKAYVPEFSSDYLRYIEQYTPFYKTPDYTKNTLLIFSKLLAYGVFSGEDFKTHFKNLENEFTKFESLLAGKPDFDSKGIAVSFPIIEIFSSIGDRRIFGLLEHIKVEIFKAPEDTFLIVPSEQEIDSRLSEQIRSSWSVALSTIKKYTSLKNTHHKVIIQFESRKGFYIGDSLGTALTIVFIKEILTYYNSPYLIDFNENISITGGIDNEGNIQAVSSLIIQKKTETVFFSPVNLFIVPKQDYPDAEMMLGILEKKFPDRKKLRIAGLKNIHDLLDRRSIIEIKKQNPLIRSGNYFRKNWLSASLLLVLLITFSAIIMSDLDDNPSSIDHQDKLLLVKNRNGKILWSLNVLYDSKTNYSNFNMLVDVDNDGVDEIIVAGIDEDLEFQEDIYQITCFDNKKEVRWSYSFNDLVSTELEEHSGTYQIFIVDTLSNGNEKFIYLISRNIPFYPSAIFRLNLKTGIRDYDNGTFWHPGGIINALIDDFNKDGKKEIAAIAISNCFERGAIFSIDINDMNGQAPSEGNYVFKGIGRARLNNYTLFPKTDFNIYYKKRYPLPVYVDYGYIREEFRVISRENDDASIHYSFDPNLDLIKVSCGDSYEVYRDELVEKGLLDPPYTNTREYFNMLKADALYWDGKTFKKETAALKKMEPIK